MSGRIHVYDTEAEWLAARRLLVTASDLPLLLGLVEPGSPWYRTPDELLREKLGLDLPKTHSAEVEQYRRWGHRLEPILREEYEDVTGFECRHDGDYAIVTSDELPWFGATLDMQAKGAPRESVELHGWGPVQIKNRGYSQRGAWLTKVAGQRSSIDDGAKTPLDTQVQLQAEMFALGASWGGCGVLLGGNTYLTRAIARDDEFIRQTMLLAALEFWEKLDAAIKSMLVKQTAKEK